MLSVKGVAGTSRIQGEAGLAEGQDVQADVLGKGLRPGAEFLSVSRQPLPETLSWMKAH